MSKSIINGIDVSECAYFNSVTYEEPYCNIDQEHLYTCSSDENCYFKQLKRLQEENKRLQMLSCPNCGEKYLSPDGAELYEKNVQLQKENKELKEKIAKFRWDNPYYDLYNNVVGQRDNYKKENEELKNRLKTLDDEEFVYEVTEIEYNNFKKMNKYKQALEKIRDIAQIHQYFNPELLEIKGDIGQMQDLKMTEIFEKCNEVLNDRD